MNAAPVIVGLLALLALSATLVVREPSPGALARAHADIGTSIETCSVCHTPDGLDAGCLACHDEIEEQVQSKRGYHATRATGCAHCHPDHHGETFDVMEAIAWQSDDRLSFRHDHVEYTLSGKHDELSCRGCHRAERTYLGLAQKCDSCHDDVHGNDQFRDCAACHDQNQFEPASLFDHDRSFPLLGQHAEAKCDRCHSGLDYKDVKGQQCHDCHESPHRFDSPDGCEACHGGADASWVVAQSEFDAARHGKTGFALSKAHKAVACSDCHKPALAYTARFPQPPRKQESCEACHEDVHRGQFEARCTDCHEETRFLPSRYGREQHTTFVLRGAHAKTECRACHAEVEETRKFVGTARTCAACHDDPHKGQFEPKGKEHGCDRCHDEQRFIPARYPMAEHTGFPLTGAHGAVACNSCHTVVQGTRRFKATPRDCASCHADLHGGQFEPEIKKHGCEQCHTTASFRIRPFDHGKRTSYPLEGKHGEAACARCHKLSGKPPVRVYRETPRSCASCHRDEHRGQFADRSCQKCHAGFIDWEIRRFDHDRTRFPLDARHSDVSCDECHPKVRQRDGRAVVQYRPMGHQCKDCHEVERR
ncbi:MAG: hypothetical protein ACYTGZ_21140 [Planctomycetota bacterium]|jgi:hypothetical protein